MNKISFVKSVFAAGLAAACVWGLAGCTSGGSGSTGGVAATVNGTEISEDKVTAAIENIRESKSLTNESAWGEWMAQYGYTPESVRSEILESYINQEVLRQGAAEMGVSVESSEIDSYVDSMKSNYETDEKWQEALQASGLTEEDYRENIELSLLYEDVVESLAVDEASEESMLSYAKMYASYYSGAKKSSHILFESGDEATAQQVLDQIKAGTLDFATAAQEYSKDSSAADGGNVGWDRLSTFVDEYQDALDNLEVGQVSDLVTSQFGIHIIKCTEEFTAPEEVTSIDQLPTEFAEQVSEYAKQADQQQAYTDWLNERREASEVVINDMPSDVPYNVDMSKYATEDESSEDDSSATEGDGSDAAAADGAATDAEGSSADAAAADSAADVAGSSDGAADSSSASSEGSEGSASSSAAQQPAEAA